MLESRRDSLGDRHFFVDAKSLAHCVADFTERGVGFYGLEEIGHQVLGASGRFAQRVQAAFDFRVRAICAQFPQAVALAMRYCFINLQNIERLFFGHIIIHADYDFLFAINGYLIAIRRFGNFALWKASLDCGDHAAQGVDFFNVIPGAALHFISERFDEVGTAERIRSVRDTAFMGDDLLRAKCECGGKLGG